MYVKHENVFHDIIWDRIVLCVLSLSRQITQNYLDQCRQEECKIVNPLTGMGPNFQKVNHKITVNHVLKSFITVSNEEYLYMTTHLRWIMENFFHLKVIPPAGAYEQPYSEDLLHGLQVNISNFWHNISHCAEDIPAERTVNTNNRLKQVVQYGIIDFLCRQSLFLNTFSSTPTTAHQDSQTVDDEKRRQFIIAARNSIGRRTADYTPVTI